MIITNNPYITVTCTKCKGEGVLTSRFGLSVENTEQCWVCKGTGKTPNEVGQHIIELVNLFGRKH